MEKDRARQALMQVHEHLSRQFPEACPISLDGPQQPEDHPVPAPAGIGKARRRRCSSPPPAAGRGSRPVGAAALKAEPEDAGLFADADVYKGFKKMRKKLGKKVLSGSMTVDEARAKLGRQFAQKGADEPQEAAAEVARSARRRRRSATRPSPARQVTDNTSQRPRRCRSGPGGHQVRRRRGHLRTEGPARQAAARHGCPAGDLHHQAR